jgi:ABC-2 type transport system permease protein
MSNLQKVQNVSIPKVNASEVVVPTWRLVLKRELTDLWIGGKAFNLLLLYSILLGLMFYTYAFSTESTPIPPQEAVFELLKNATSFSIFIGLIIGADSLSGERDRSTLESLLLTPVDRRHVVLAKLLAGISIWPAAYLIVLPFLYVIAQGSKVLAPAMFWGAITGTLLVIGYTGLGMLVSFWSSSNKISYFVSLGFYALHLLPVELTGDGVDIAGEVLQWINPVSSVNYFLSNHLVYFHRAAEYWPWLTSSILMAIGTVGLLLNLARSKLRLEPALRRKMRALLRRFVGMMVIVVLLLFAFSTGYAHTAHASRVQHAGLNISIDSQFKQVKMGDIVEFHTTVSNNGLQISPPIIAALNIVNLEVPGENPDLDEWTPQRTQHIASLEPDESINLNWQISTGLPSDYIVYVVLIPQPASAEVNTYPVGGTSMYLTVAPVAGLNPDHVLPLAIGVPAFLLAITFLVYRRRRQQIDVGYSL